MARGDHFYVWRRCGVVPFQHHAIDLGDGNAIHFSDGANEAAGPSRNSARFIVAKVSLDVLTRNREDKVYLVTGPDCQDKIELVVSRAESQLGRRGYHLFHDNCEHFAYWCSTGHSKSCQVTVVAERASSIGIKATLLIASRIAVKSAKVIKPWTLAADVVQLGTEVVGHRFGLSNPTARKRASRVLGGMTAIGIGTLGGPTGIVIAGGTWALGELSGEVTARSIAKHQLRRKRQETFVNASVNLD